MSSTLRNPIPVVWDFNLRRLQLTSSRWSQRHSGLSVGAGSGAGRDFAASGLEEVGWG